MVVCQHVKQSLTTSRMLVHSARRLDRCGTRQCPSVAQKLPCTPFRADIDYFSRPALGCMKPTCVTLCRLVRHICWRRFLTLCAVNESQPFESELCAMLLPNACGSAHQTTVTHYPSRCQTRTANTRRTSSRTAHGARSASALAPSQAPGLPARHWGGCRITCPWGGASRGSEGRHS
jgi:hypothetical protein